MPDGVPLPPIACWRHRGARDGFEVVFFDDSREGGLCIEGHTAAVEDGNAFAVTYSVEFDDRWRTRRARVVGRSPRGVGAVTLTSDAGGKWLVDGHEAPGLDGCLDVDFESSAFTNALPIHRLQLGRGDEADVPAAYVHALTLETSRLEQRYRRVDDDAGGQRYEYAAPAYDFRCLLSYDNAGLVLDYPGIAVRVDC